MEKQPVPKKVPFELTHIVCTCNEGEQRNAIPKYLNGKLMRHQKNPSQHACRNCGKYYRWVMRTCWGCGEAYTQTFTHPLRCITQPHCWNCLQEKESPVCAHDECSNIKAREKRSIHEQDLTRREKPDLSKVELPDIDW